MNPGGVSSPGNGASLAQAGPDLAVIDQATEHQPRVRAALTAALKGEPSHAYLLHGPAGAGKGKAARAFAAELLATAAHGGAAAETRRRALLDPSPHPDLVWLAPEGLQHRVEDIRERVIRIASRRPFEGGRRVFVIEQAEAMREEAQNALLKTLEEPPSYVHLILISQTAEEVLPTVRSRCQMIEFAMLPPAVVESMLADDPAMAGTPGETLRALARLSCGDNGRARHLASATGGEIRAAVEAFIGSALSRDQRREEPWAAILKVAEQAGAEAEADAQARLDREAELGIKISKVEAGQAVRREARRARTEVLDLSLDLMQQWLRDLSVVAVGASELANNADRHDVLQAQRELVRDGGPRLALMRVGEYRRRLRLNVSEELAFESLHSELRRTLQRSR